jgi:hypothetical protein
MRRAEQDPSRRQALGHHREEFAGGLIDPVQIFEDDDQRTNLGDGVQQPPDRLEDTGTAKFRVERRNGRVARIDR